MGKFLQREAFHLLCGKQIGKGAFRRVYECGIDPTLVVKVEDSSRSFANIGEWDIWTNYNETDIGKWLAPCTHISPCGGILLQKRVDPARESDLPKKVPSFLTDLKQENFGVYEGRVVCCDYGSVLADLSARLKRADW